MSINVNAIFFIESIIFCLSVFVFILVKYSLGMEKKNGKIYFMLLLISQIVYLTLEIFWACVKFEIIPKNGDLF